MVLAMSRTTANTGGRESPSLYPYSCRAMCWSVIRARSRVGNPPTYGATGAAASVRRLTFADFPTP